MMIQIKTFPIFEVKNSYFIFFIMNITIHIYN